MYDDFGKTLDFDKDQRMIKQGKENISRYFASKSYFCGGPIPERLLFSKESLQFVMCTEFHEGISYAQELLVPQVPPPIDFHNQISWEVESILKLIHHATANAIPILWQAGLVLLDFKYCQGCDVTFEEYSEWMASISIAA